MMELIANDPLRVTAATPSKISAGEKFEINDDEGRILLARGLAREVAAADAAAAAAEAEAAGEPEADPVANGETSAKNSKKG